MRLVFVRHENSQKYPCLKKFTFQYGAIKTFLFLIVIYCTKNLHSSMVRLKHYVQVNTMHGPAFGRVVGGTFNISDDDLNNFANAVGAYMPIKRVIGYLLSILNDNVPF